VLIVAYLPKRVTAVTFRKWGTNLAISHDVQQRDDIRAPREILEYLDLPLDLLFLHRLERLDDTFLIVTDVYAFKHLRVLAPTYAKSTYVSTNHTKG